LLTISITNTKKNWVAAVTGNTKSCFKGMGRPLRARRPDVRRSSVERTVRLRRSDQRSTERSTKAHAEVSRRGPNRLSNRRDAQSSRCGGKWGSGGMGEGGREGSISPLP